MQYDIEKSFKKDYNIGCRKFHKKGDGISWTIVFCYM